MLKRVHRKTTVLRKKRLLAPHLVLVRAASLSFMPPPTPGRTSIFSHKNNKATLQGSTAATWALPRIGHRSNSICSRRSTGFGRESPCRLSRHLQHATKPAETRDCRALEDAFKNATAALSGKIGGIGAALSPRRVDVVVVRKRKVEVPRGRRVNERMWTEFNRRQRKVTFCPDVEVSVG